MSEINQDFLQRLTSLLDKGDEEFKKQNYVSAIKKCDTALEFIVSQNLSQKEMKEILYEKLDCLYLRIFAYFEVKELDPSYKNAYESAHEILEINKDMPYANYLFGVIGYLRGYPNEAIPYLLKESEADPNDPLILHGLGILYKHAGKEKEAIKYLQEAEKLSPGITRQHPDEPIYLLSDIRSLNKSIDTVVPIKFREKFIMALIKNLKILGYIFLGLITVITTLIVIGLIVRYSALFFWGIRLPGG